jgi:hypothetical protein
VVAAAVAAAVRTTVMESPDSLAVPGVRARLWAAAAALPGWCSGKPVPQGARLRRNVALHSAVLPGPGAPAAAWRHAQRGPRLSVQEFYIGEEVSEVSDLAADGDAAAGGGAADLEAAKPDESRPRPRTMRPRTMSSSRHEAVPSLC